MCSAMLLSARKCWPSALLGRSRCASSSAWICARRHRSTPNTRAALARVSSAMSLGVDATGRGERGADDRHEGGLVRLAAVRNRREVRAVGLDEDPVGGRERGRGAHVVGRLERHDAAERQVAVAVERGARFVGAAGEAVEDRARRARPRRRARGTCRPTRCASGSSAAGRRALASCDVRGGTRPPARRAGECS